LSLFKVFFYKAPLFKKKSKKKDNSKKKKFTKSKLKCDFDF